jgi:C-terminal processing protease CtpA/Prc
LSLAKRMGHDGIYIRNIADGSLAEREGTLKVGDRIWEINGDSVADDTPVDVVSRLKSIDGAFEIVVRRTRA